MKQYLKIVVLILGIILFSCDKREKPKNTKTVDTYNLSVKLHCVYSRNPCDSTYNIVVQKTHGVDSTAYKYNVKATNIKSTDDELVFARNIVSFNNESLNLIASKTFVVDGKSISIGKYNRMGGYLYLNKELGLVVNTLTNSNLILLYYVDKSDDLANRILLDSIFLNEYPQAHIHRRQKWDDL